MKRFSPTVVEIDLKALRFNFRQLRRRIPKGVRTLCVVKSDAYGHSAVPVATALQSEGADFFGVGTVDEGIHLRRAGIRRPILILLGIVDGYLGEILEYRLSPVLYDLGTARRLNTTLLKRRRRLEVHLKVDTGMSRLGIPPEEVGRFSGQLKRLKALEPVGLMTHLADAGEAGFTRRQFWLFEKARHDFGAHFPGSHLFHIANSQAVLRVSRGRFPSGANAESVETRWGVRGGERYLPPLWMVRLGIALYGAYPLERDRRLVRLRPVMSLKSRLLLLKDLPPGTPVSYGRSFTTPRRSRIGVLPVGYADGYPRILSNRGEALVRGKRVPIVGKICMDMMMVDLTAVPGARSGDRVVLIGRQGKAEIRAEEVAAKAGTISYEIFCRVAERIRRDFR